VTTTKTITIAVLPFENLSTEDQLDLFCRSFCIDLITELSYFRQFRILAYQSVRHLNSSTDHLNEKLASLEADYIVQGSFRHAAHQILINAQLIEREANRLVWGNRIEGQINELMGMQEFLLKEVVASLQLQLNYDLLNQIKQKSNVKLKAYEYWLHGVDELKKGSIANDIKAREYFEQALSIEPDYSLAYSGMSLTYFNEWSCQLWDRWDVSQNGAYEWAQKAIEIDEQNYIAAFILGRVFLYQGAYESAEYYLRKSLALNANDPESVIQVASCMTYLGYGQEALDLYERTLRLNPINAENYDQIGAFIYFELGQYEKARALAIKTKRRRWVDTDAFYAGIYFQLGDLNAARRHWEIFMDSFKASINNGVEATSQEAVEWMTNVNPYKHETKLLPFWNYITQNKARTSQTKVSKSQPSPASGDNVFIKNGSLWEWSFEGQQGYLPEVKGYQDILRLIAHPGQLFHCTELMDAAVIEQGEQLLDVEAKRQYQKKIREIHSEISDAESCNDYVRSATLHKEYDTLVDHLTRSFGIRGAVREAGGTVERARSAITWRIRSAISKIEKASPSLGKHLSNSIKTGTFCTYSPEQTIVWNSI
jgi:TolB-like protein/Tfp pilus assembly protein PilF